MKWLDHKVEQIDEAERERLRVNLDKAGMPRRYQRYETRQRTFWQKVRLVLTRAA